MKKEHILVGILMLILIMVWLPVGFWKNFSIDFTGHAVGDNGIVAYYNLDGNSKDTIGGNNGISYSINFISGRINQAAGFNGNNSYIDFGKPAILSNMTRGTISVWAYYNSSSNFIQLIGTYRGGEPGTWFLGRFHTPETKLVVYYNSSSTRTLIAFPDKYSSGWNHYVITLDGTNIRGYFNGNLIGNFSELDSPIFNSGDYFRAGAFSHSKIPQSGFLNGGIDELRLYNSALSDSKVTDLYNSATMQNPVCGNNIIETGEECDGGNRTCMINNTSGVQSCSNNCNWGSCIVNAFQNQTANETNVTLMNNSCLNLYFEDDSDKNCSNKSFCGEYMHHGLHTFSSKEECLDYLNHNQTSGENQENQTINQTEENITGKKCSFSNAYWGTNYSKMGDNVELIVEGTPECNGKEVGFQIYEDTNVFDKITRFILSLFNGKKVNEIDQPSDFTFSNNVARASWTAENNLTSNANYGFTASLVDDTGVKINGEDSLVVESNVARKLSLTSGGFFAPVNLEITETYGDSNFAAQLKWDDNSNNEAGFEVWRSYDNITWNLYTDLTPNTYKFNVAEKWYINVNYKVRAYQDSPSGRVYSDFSNTLSFETIHAPVYVYAYSYLSSQAVVAWYDRDDPIDGFRVWRSINDADHFEQYASITRPFPILTVGETDWFVFNDTNIDSNTLYYYKINAYNNSLGDGPFVYNEIDSVAPKKVPNAPLALQMHFTNNSEIEIVWDDNSNNENGFVLQNSSDGIAWTNTVSKPWKQLRPYLSHPELNSKISKVNMGQTYYFRIYAYNQIGNSSYLTNSITVPNIARPNGKLTWYVDKDTDCGLNCDGTSWQNAWSIDKIYWPFVKPGDTIYISGGITGKTYAGTLFVSASGNETDSITIRSGQDAGHNGQVIISNPLGDGIEFDDNLKYIIINGSYNGKNNIILKDNGQNGVNNLPSYSKLFNLDIVHNGYLDNSEGILLEDHIDYYEIAYCNITKNKESAIIAINGNSTREGWSHNKIHDNSIQYITCEALKVAWLNSDIYDNIIGPKNNEAICSQHQNGIGGINSPGNISLYVRIFDNYFVDLNPSFISIRAGNPAATPSGTKIGNFTVKNLMIYNNVFERKDSPITLHVWGLQVNNNACNETTSGCSITFQNFFIANNVFVNLYTGFSISNSYENSPNYYENFTIANNIFSNVQVPIGMENKSFVKGSINVMDNNIIYKGSEGSSTFDFLGKIYKNFTDANWINNYPTWGHNLNSQPLFYNSNYRNKLGSPAIDNGINLSNYTNAPLILFDKEGNRRGVNEIWDIGAYEYHSGQTECLHGEQQLCDKQNGVCRGTSETCNESNVFPDCSVLDYHSNSPFYEERETSCYDGLDNDCDGNKDLSDKDCLPNNCNLCNSELGANCVLDTCHRIGDCYYQGNNNCVDASVECSNIQNCSQLNQYECKIDSCGNPNLDCRLESGKCTEFDPTLVLAFDFENYIPEKGIIEDKSGFNNNGWCNDSLNYSCPSVINGHDNSNGANFKGGNLSVEGSGNVIRVENSESLNNLTGGTIVAWIYYKNESPTSTKIIDAWDSSTKGSWLLGRINAYNTKFMTRLENNSGSWKDYTIINFPDSKAVYWDKWNFYVVTFNQTEIRGYFNGKLNSTYIIGQDTTIDYPSQYILGGYYLAIGAFGHYKPTPPTSGWLNGSLDDIRIYKKILSKEEILNLYNGTPVIDTVPPIFTDLNNKNLQLGSSLTYQINAQDSSGISCFKVNNTNNFNINCSGYLKNITSLNVGLYYLNITVNDSSNNKNSGVIYINVSQSAPVQVCGNYLIEGNEICDRTNLTLKSCQVLLGMQYTGILRCFDNCSGYNLSLCVFHPEIQCIDADRDGRLDYNSTSCPAGTDQCVQINFDFSQFGPLFNSSQINLTYNSESGDLRNVTNINLERKGIGKIKFLKKIKLIGLNETGCFIPLNITPLVTIANNQVDVESQNYSDFNNSAEILFDNVTLSKPLIKRDNSSCPADICTNITFNSTSKIFSFDVSGFSTYRLVEQCSDGIQDGDETGTDCGGSCAACGCNVNCGGGGGGGSGRIPNNTTNNNTLNNTNNKNIINQIRDNRTVGKKVGDFVSINSRTLGEKIGIILVLVILIAGIAAAIIIINWKRNRKIINGPTERVRESKNESIEKTENDGDSETRKKINILLIRGQNYLDLKLKDRARQIYGELRETYDRLNGKDKTLYDKIVKFYGKIK